MASECKNSFWVIFFCTVCLFVCLCLSQRAIVARGAVGAASVCPVGAHPIPLDSFPNEV